MKQNLNYLSEINVTKGHRPQPTGDKDDDQKKGNLKNKMGEAFKTTVHGALTMNSVISTANPRDRALTNYQDNGAQKLIDEQKRKLQDEKAKNEKLQKENENLKKIQEEMQQEYQRLHMEY